MIGWEQHQRGVISPARLALPQPPPRIHARSASMNASRYSSSARKHPQDAVILGLAQDAAHLLCLLA